MKRTSYYSHHHRPSQHDGGRRRPPPRPQQQQQQQQEQQQQQQKQQQQQQRSYKRQRQMTSSSSSAPPPPPPPITTRTKDRNESSSSSSFGRWKSSSSSSSSARGEFVRMTGGGGGGGGVGYGVVWQGGRTTKDDGHPKAQNNQGNGKHNDDDDDDLRIENEEALIRMMTMGNHGQYGGGGGGGGDNQDDNDRNDDDDDESDEEERARKRREQRRKERLARVRQENEEGGQEIHSDHRRPPPPPQQQQQDQQQRQDKRTEGVQDDMDGKDRGTEGGREHVHVRRDHDRDDKDEDEDEDEDEFDMFSSSVSPVNNKSYGASASADANANAAAAAAPAVGRVRKEEDAQDQEGYYKAVIGEVLEIVPTHQFKVLGVVGKGVFSTVLKCSVAQHPSKSSSSNNNNSNNNSNNNDDDNNDDDEDHAGMEAYTGPPPPSLPPTVAIKFIRNNETMAKAAQREVRFLQKISHPNVVPLLLPASSSSTGGGGGGGTSPFLEHMGHVVMVFPFVAYNLRDVLQKFGKGVGLSLTAVRSYFYQLLLALRTLEKAGILHADLKPDNILVTDDFATCQVCDFGSAFELDSADAGMPTPYLVSRYYRAPEIILGCVPATPAIDLWSVGVTVAELFLGRILLDGKTNNDMLRVMMERLGPFSNRTLRQHQVALAKTGGIIPVQFRLERQHFVFLQQAVDTVTNRAVVRPLDMKRFPTRPLTSLLLGAKSAKDPKQEVLQFADLLSKCLHLEPSRRVSVSQAVKHPFFAPILPRSISSSIAPSS